MKFLRDFRLPRPWRSDAGSATVVVAVSLPVLMLTAGLAIDFSRASSLRTALNSIADSAALITLTPTMMLATPSAATTAATNFFNGQAASLVGISAGSLSVTVSYAATSNPLQRITTVSYTANSSNFFAGLEPSSMFAIGGSSTAKATLPPNIDFYMLFDNSSSMAAPATSAGVNQMNGLTTQQGGGCALACHQGNTNMGDTTGNPCLKNGVYSTPKLSSPPPSTSSGNSYCAASQGAQIDNYALARQNGIVLRMDAITLAVTGLMADAVSFANSGIYTTPPQYRFAAYSMDTLWSVPTSNNLLMSLTANYTSGWSSASSQLGVMEMWQDGSSCTSAACTSGNPSGIGPATNYDYALSSVNQTMPNPGNGSNSVGDTPKEVLFFVTDGVEDELMNNAQIMQPLNAGVAHNYCGDIKARGIQIAILYTEYIPIPNNWFYNDYVAPFIPQVAPALQACASPGLFIDASLSTDLPTAMKTLFQAAVSTATLTK